MLAPTTQRVEYQTARTINHQIREETKQSLAEASALGRESISRRLRELDREWTIERVIEVEAPLTILAGLILGRLHRGWRLVPLFAASMLLYHNTRGGYPLLPILRRMRLRTQREIAVERHALKVLRGDFGQSAPSSPRSAWLATAPEEGGLS